MMDQKTPKSPVVTRLVEGDPLPVEGQTLVPLVRVTSRVQRRASLLGDRVSGQGYGFVHMRPLAILNKGTSGQRYEIRNETGRIIGWLILAGLFIPWLAMLLVLLSRRRNVERSSFSSA